MNTADVPDFDSEENAAEYWQWLSEYLGRLKPAEESTVGEPEPLF